MKIATPDAVETIAAAIRLWYWRLRSIMAAAMMFPFMASPGRCTLRPRACEDVYDTTVAVQRARR